jgi:hypothetical protein
VFSNNDFLKYFELKEFFSSIFLKLVFSIVRVTFILALISVSPHLSRCIWTGDQKEEKERENEKKVPKPKPIGSSFFCARYLPVKTTSKENKKRRKIKL